MKKTSKFVLAVMATILFAAPAFADDKATKPQAEAMVKKAVAAIKSEGKDKVFAEINAKDAKYVDRDLYVVVYGLNGDCLAHGSNAKLIGKNLLDTQDADGKFFVKERVDMAKAQPNFWQEYKFSNPTTKKIEPKEMYCERLEETAVCAGVYK